MGQLVLKLNRHITFQRYCLSPGLANRSGEKLNVSGKLSCVEYRVGMDWNEEVLFTL